MFLVVNLATYAQPDQWEFRFGPRFWGATAAGRYMIDPPSVEGVETSITALLSAAYETVGYYRAPDGSLFTVPAGGPNAEATAFNRFDMLWQVGVQQGILPRVESANDAAVAFLLYRGQYDLPFRDDSQLFFTSGLPEADGSLRGSFVGGLAYSLTIVDAVTRVKQGIAGELALEWGPSFLHNQILGLADYNRTTLSARGFVPLYEAPARDGRNVFSSYLAAFGVLDWATGPEIPQIIRQSTGGRSLRSAPGGSVRGYGSGRFDSTLKILGNMEIRANLPAIVLPQIVPGLVLYTDVGYFLDEQDVSPQSEERSGFLLSSGAGFYLDLFAAAELVFYTNYLWMEPDVEGSRWVPFSLGFGFHY